MFSANQIAGFLNQLFFQNKSMKNIFNILKKIMQRKLRVGRGLSEHYIYFYYQDYYKKPNIKKYNV